MNEITRPLSKGSDDDDSRPLRKTTAKLAKDIASPWPLDEAGRAKRLAKTKLFKKLDATAQKLDGKHALNKI